jgi:formate hydrogenlyase subunit 4
VSFNLVAALLLAPLFEGVMRKLKAVIHSRKGPPITQPYLDLLKLLGKEDIQSGGGVVFRMAPVVVLAAMLLAAMLTPMGGKPPLGMAGDTIVWIYVISLAAVMIMLGAFASGNPFAYEGASREMMMILSVEPIVIAAVVTAGVKAGTLSLGGIIDWQLMHGPTLSMAFAGIAFFLALQANLGRLPFDIVEAESEIVEGPFIEYSGPRLALYKMAFYIRQIVFSFFLVSIFVPWPMVKVYPLAVLISLAKVLVVLLVAGLIECVNPRLRIDQSMNYMSRVLFVALAGLVFAAMGV